MEKEKMGAGVCDWRGTGVCGPLAPRRQGPCIILGRTDWSTGAQALPVKLTNTGLITCLHYNFLLLVLL